MDRARRRIMLVDDNLSNLMSGGKLLQPFYEVYLADSAARMFELLEQKLPDLILLDVAMPGTDGYAALKTLKTTKRYAEIPVIFLTAMNDEKSEMRGFDLGAVDYISKPFSAALLLKRVENQLLILKQRAFILQNTENLMDLVRKKSLEIFDVQNAMLDTIADMVEFRDTYTGEHSAHAQLYLKTLIDGLCNDPEYADEIFQWDMSVLLPSAQLHDIGKIAMPDAILRKPGKLTAGEFGIMKTHVEKGVDVVKRIMEKLSRPSMMDHALRIVGAHHERWDGTGYPAGLKGNDIPLEGRLMAVADVYDALISARPYREALTHEKAMEIMEAGAGTQFDPSLVGILLRVEKEFQYITRKKQKACK